MVKEKDEMEKIKQNEVKERENEEVCVAETVAY